MSIDINSNSLQLDSSSIDKLQKSIQHKQMDPKQQTAYLKLLAMIKDGIQPDEIGAILSLLGAIGGAALFPGIIGQMRNAVDQMKLDQRSLMAKDQLDDWSTQILEAIMSEMMDKINAATHS